MNEMQVKKSAEIKQEYMAGEISLWQAADKLIELGINWYQRGKIVTEWAIEKGEA